MTDYNLNTPFIKKFSHQKLFYIYDVNTYQIIRVEKPVFDIIEHYRDNGDSLTYLRNKFKNTYSDDQLKHSIKQIEEAIKEHGLFSTFRPRHVTLGVGDPQQLKEFQAKQGLQQLLLELTGNCNLNCQYCEASGKYAGTTVHNKHMSKETCRKAVDFFCEQSHDSDMTAISFYGGEPLLEFPLLKDTVLHVKQNHHPTRYHFNLTTNGTLLNKEIIDFFYEHDMAILVSLDGPEHIHDRYRLTRDGKGSFRRIMENLRFIRRYNKDYYSRRVAIYGVLSPPFHLDEVLDFYTTEETLTEIRNGRGIKGGVVDVEETTFLDDFNLREYEEDFGRTYIQLVERYKEMLLNKKRGSMTIEKRTIESILSNLARRPVQRLFETAVPLGACHPGVRRLFVNTDGEFHICERAHNHYKLGNVDSGFDLDLMVEYYRKMDAAIADCKDCWAISHCERCWAKIGDIDDFRGENKERFCNTQKKVIEIAFKAYVELLKKDPDCLKVFGTHYSQQD